MSENQTSNVRLGFLVGWSEWGRVAGLGVDICEIDRLRQAIRRQKHRMRDRLFTHLEQMRAAASGNLDLAQATGYAVKEATSKALGTGITGRVGWRDIEFDLATPGQVSLAGGAHRRAQWLSRPTRTYRVYVESQVGSDTVTARVVIEALQLKGVAPKGPASHTKHTDKSDHQ